ncbi:MAG: hypothetical protein A3K06_03510 [Candidatus Doudnabacteria bacterium RIFCSPHIGHO2_01_52_17]|uniref:Uncharacterized protein n=1 Tax=Candidatus Doudnabacteria bacterium RIFCSPHIGHO2_01_52_17 TaxID=1817820 RepID=A0A1F5NEB7_9BACT|nr:MAG: hypothetical protein A3K06_03510 [Candidatus Doudnabacteria bacterium RIFCSPHIGHO2_01_52_17]
MAFNDFFLYFGMVVIGLLLEDLARRLHFIITKTHYKEHHFTFGKYFFLLLFPLVAVFITTLRLGTTALSAFLICAAVGTFLEWLVGFSYYQVVGERLWTYHRYAIKKYTSFLSIPIWGLAGVFIWLLSRAIS